MNYQNIYNQFIQDRQSKQNFTGYAENHHILPRALGGDDSKSNIIRLTAEDHARAHVLLAKIHGGKMWGAVLFIVGNRYKSRIPTKRETKLFAMARENMAKVMSENNHMKEEKYRDLWRGKNNPMMSKEIRDKVSKTRIDNKLGFCSEEIQSKIREAKKSPEHRAKMSELTTGANNAMYGMHGGKNPNSREVQCVETGRIFKSVKDASTWCKGDVTKASRTGNKAGGYHWVRLTAHKNDGKITKNA